MRDLIVIGGGAIGLATALEASRAGLRVSLVDPAPGAGAVWAAAGMLAPISEAHFGEEDLGQLLVRAAGIWPAFATRVEEISGRPVGLETSGTLQLAVNASDRMDLERMVAFQRSLGLEVQDIPRDELTRVEPSLAPGIRYAALVPQDHRVDNRLLVEALLEAIRVVGVDVIRARAIRIDHEGGREQVTTAEGTLDADGVVVAMGAATSHLEGLDRDEVPPVRPVKGQIIRLGGPPGALHRTIRATVRGRSVYLVPRASGEIVVGATVEERGFDASIRVGEIFRLLDDARRVLPGIDEMELRDTSCGLRPATASNAPTIKRLEGTNCIISTGHYRNGILLAPISARYAVSLLCRTFDEDAVRFEAVAL